MTLLLDADTDGQQARTVASAGLPMGSELTGTNVVGAVAATAVSVA